MADNDITSPGTADLPFGAFRRRVVVVPEEGMVRAALEDEMHRMELIVFHDRCRVTDIQATTHRVPWDSCPQAAVKLRDLIGVRLNNMTVSTGHDGKQHCTHLFDLVRLAMAHATGEFVQYDIAIADRIDNATRGELARNGRHFLAWDVAGYTVSGPDPFTGHSLLGAPNWSVDSAPELIEAALMLRRGFLVAEVRSRASAMVRSTQDTGDEQKRAIQSSGILGRCFTFQTGRFENASRLHSWRNFSNRKEDLLMDFAGTHTQVDAGDAATNS